jgi:hypothetical protein
VPTLHAPLDTPLPYVSKATPKHFPLLGIPFRSAVLLAPFFSPHLTAPLGALGRSRRLPYGHLLNQAEAEATVTAAVTAVLAAVVTLATPLSRFGL